MSQFFGGDSQYLVEQKKKHKRLLLLILAASLTISVLITAFSLIHQKLLYITYPLAGLSLLGYFWFRKHSKNEAYTLFSFAKGARGEKNIAQLLRRLSDEYLVFQDIILDANQGNIDFVVVGPKGIYAIEVKSHKGQITYEQEQLMQDGKPFERNLIRQTMNEAMNLHDFLLEKIGKEFFVYPVLVFSNSSASMRFGFKPIQHVSIVQAVWLEKLIAELESKSEQDLNQEELRQALQMLLQSN